MENLFKEDLRDLTRIQDLSEVQMLAELLQHQAAQLTSIASLAKKIRVHNDTIKHWINILSSLYYCFLLRPWHKNVSRSLIKEPKVFLWDWSLIADTGAKHENFVACHLLKAVDYWNDTGRGHYHLYYIRDKDKREVDFVVTKEDSPWFLVEVKSSQNADLSPSLKYFQNKLNVPHAFQVVFDMDYVDVDCFTQTRPVIVPAQTFLSQLM